MSNKAYCSDCKEKIIVKDGLDSLLDKVMGKKDGKQYYIEYQDGIYRCASCVIAHRKKIQEELKNRKLDSPAPTKTIVRMAVPPQEFITDE